MYLMSLNFILKMVKMVKFVFLGITKVIKMQYEKWRITGLLKSTSQKNATMLLGQLRHRQTCKGRRDGPAAASDLSFPG